MPIEIVWPSNILASLSYVREQVGRVASMSDGQRCLLAGHLVEKHKGEFVPLIGLYPGFLFINARKMWRSMAGSVFDNPACIERLDISAAFEGLKRCERFEACPGLAVMEKIHDGSYAWIVRTIENGLRNGPFSVWELVAPRVQFETVLPPDIIDLTKCPNTEPLHRTVFEDKNGELWWIPGDFGTFRPFKLSELYRLEEALRKGKPVTWAFGLRRLGFNENGKLVTTDLPTIDESPPELRDLVQFATQR